MPRFSLNRGIMVWPGGEVLLMSFLGLTSGCYRRLRRAWSLSSVRRFPWGGRLPGGGIDGGAHHVDGGECVERYRGHGRHGGESQKRPEVRPHGSASRTDRSSIPCIRSSATSNRNRTDPGDRRIHRRFLPVGAW